MMKLLTPHQLISKEAAQVLLLPHVAQNHQSHAGETTNGFQSRVVQKSESLLAFEMELLTPLA